MECIDACLDRDSARLNGWEGSSNECGIVSDSLRQFTVKIRTLFCSNMEELTNDPFRARCSQDFSDVLLSPIYERLHP
jgi:hypothetical protein